MDYRDVCALLSTLIGRGVSCELLAHGGTVRLFIELPDGEKQPSILEVRDTLADLGVPQPAIEGASIQRYTDESWTTEISVAMPGITSDDVAL